MPVKIISNHNNPSALVIPCHFAKIWRTNSAISYSLSQQHKKLAVCCGNWAPASSAAALPRIVILVKNLKQPHSLQHPFHHFKKQLKSSGQSEVVRNYGWPGPRWTKDLTLWQNHTI